MIYEPKLSLIESEYISDRSTIVDEVSYSHDGLNIVLECESWRIKVYFDAVWGFRVLDEGDLSEFWTECNLTKGWCFEVFDGGWNALENSRDHFVTGKLYNHREFLIIGLNECVSILAQETPVVTELPPSNKSI